MDSVASHKSIMESIDTIREFVSSDPAVHPAQFVLDLAHIWKGRGGTVAGKPRHSDRYLDDLLRGLGTPVKSLTPKLAGRTHLRPADAGTLVQLFLSHWDYVEDSNSSDTGAAPSRSYKPMLSERAIEEVCGYIENRMSAVGLESQSEVEEAIGSALPGQDTFELITAEFQKSVALFTVGAGQTHLVPRPELALIGFRDVIDRLRALDEPDRQRRILIWTLDLGRQDIEDPESGLRFINVQALITRFKALQLFKEAETEARWNWLQSRTIIVLHDTRSGRPDVPWLPRFDPHHVLFSAIPPRWAGSPEFQTLYGTERLHETTYTIFLRNSAESAVARGELSNEQNYELRYFGHALLKFDERDSPQRRGLQLNAPGRSYVEALGTVFGAAARILGLPSTSGELTIDGMRINLAHATEKLRHHGFLLLRLDEFMRF